MHDRLKFLLSRPRSGVYYPTKLLSVLVSPTPIIAQSIQTANEFLEQGKPIVYVAGPLTHTDEATRDRYVATKTLVESAGGLAYLPHERGSDPKRNPEVSAEDVWTLDFLWTVVIAEAVVIWGYPPSLGPGIQLGWVDVYQIPAAFIYDASRPLSRLAQAIGQRVTLIKYHSQSDWQAPLTVFLETHLKVGKGHHG